MRFIKSDVNGLLDYAFGVALIAAPWLFGFANSDTSISDMSTLTPIAIGICLIGMSLMTQYRYSVVKKIAYSTHLLIEMFLGALLAGSPWLFGFHNYVIWPHLVVGLVMIAVGFFSVRMDSVNKTNRLMEGTVR